jgi:hypothetical protein
MKNEIWKLFRFSIYHFSFFIAKLRLRFVSRPAVCPCLLLLPPVFPCRLFLRTRLHRRRLSPLLLRCPALPGRVRPLQGRYHTPHTKHFRLYPCPYRRGHQHRIRDKFQSALLYLPQELLRQRHTHQIGAATGLMNDQRQSNRGCQFLQHSFISIFSSMDLSLT